MRVRLANLNIWMVVCAMIVMSCSKGSSTVAKSRENSYYTAKTAKNYLNIPARYTFSDNIEFFVATQNGTPLPAIGSEFKAFDITAMYEGGTELKPEKVPVMLKTFQDNWNTNFFNLQANGEISTVVTCENATTREGCVGDLTGSSSKTDRDGRAFTGYKTPDGLGSVVAIVLKVPEGSSASNLMQYATVQIQAWRDWGKNGESPLEATLLLVPQLEDDNGNPVVKAGVGFSVNLIVPGLPTTPKGSGFAFDIETTGVAGVDNDRIVVPNGKKVNCNFRGGLCSLPGGPFKVLSPTTMTISVKPSDPNFPVKPATITIPVISGRARTIMLSTTYPATKVTNLCLSDTDFSRPCIDISADIDELQIYPFLADEGGNFVGFVPTQWSATGPLATRLMTDKVDSFQKILPITTGSGIISVSTEKGISAQFTYMIRSGAPAKVQFKTEHSIGSNSTERVGVPFKVISTLYDKKDNLCVDYNTTFGVKLKLNNAYPSTPPPGIVATATLADEIDQTVNKILVTRGIGTTTGSFTVVKVPDIAGGQLYPTISILDSTLLVSIINATPITILPGNVTQSQLRNLAGGLGTPWDLVASGATGTSFEADRTIIVRADQQYFFNNAGYDAGGNYVIDVPSKFWGVSYIYHSGTQPAFDGLVASLKDKDPSLYSDAIGCINPIPNSTPSTNQLPTNQPEGNMVYCGVHRALASKQGVSSPLASVGIPGAGRVLAIPLDITVKAAISPILNITSGLASKIKIDLVDTNPAAVPFVLGNPITAGKPFKIRLTATDNDDVLASDFAGVKTFDFSSSASPSWGGIPPVLPDGSKTCTFIAGVCTLSDTYLISRGTGTAGVISSQTITSIAMEQLIPNGEVGVVGINTQFIRSIPGAEKYIFFTDKKGGTTTGSIALQPSSLPGGISIKASQEFGFGVAIADSSGNYIRDMALSDNISVKGFEGTYTDLTNGPDYFFNFTTGTASSTPWPADFTKNDILTPNATPPAGVDPTPKKFYDPSIAADVAKISTTTLKDASKYSLVLSPQNRLGKAFAVPYSATNPSLVGWPSPNIEITPGVIDHVASDLYDPNDATVNNTNAMPGICKNLKFKLSDAKGNQLLDYTTVTNVRLKIFKVDPTHPNGIDDPKVNASSLAPDQYALLNAAEIPGPIHAGFDALSGTGGADYSLEAQARRFTGPSASVINNSNANTDPNAPTLVSNYFSDWWYGSVPVNSGLITFPGTVCFHAAETLANRLSAPQSQYIFQVEIEPSTYANTPLLGIASRGANRIFYDPSTTPPTAYGSTALGAGHEDIITVTRGGAHHLHPAFVDDFADPKLGWIAGPQGSGLSGGVDSRDQLGVESPCPYPTVGFFNVQNRGGCGSKTVYWHIHDKACNYIGPATGVSVTDPTAQVGQSYLAATPTASGAQGSSAHSVKSNNNLAGSASQWATRLYVSKGTLLGGWATQTLAGKPSSLGSKVTVTNGSLNVDEGFSIDFGLKDQFGNDVSASTKGPGSPETNLYITDRMRKVWTNGLPSNAPTGQGPSYAVNNSPTRASWTFDSYATALAASSSAPGQPANAENFLSFVGLQFRKANEIIAFSAEFKDEVVSPWCAIPGNCPTTGLQTYTMSSNLNLLPGATVAADILSQPSQAGLSFTTANFPSIFGAVEYPFTPRRTNTRGNYAPKDAYGCLKDQWGNLFNCYTDSSWSIVDKRDKSNALTSDPILSSDNILGLNLAATNKMQFEALKEGSARLHVEQGGFIAESDPLVVWAGPLAWLSLDAGASFNNDQAPSPIAAGQEIPVNMCLVDAANNVITTPVIHSGVTKTNPNIPYNVTFTSNVRQNAEGNGLVMSTGSGANFDSQIIPNGTNTISFTNGCKSIYLKNYSSANQNPGALLSVSTSDPLRPTTSIPKTDGLFVSTTTPGALDHFATEYDKAASVPVGGTVPAWSNVQANAGYANAGGNRFDLLVYARDFYGNSVNVTTPITLSRIKSDGVTAVSRQMICPGQTSIGNTSCLTANFNNSNQVVITGLTSDIPGIMYAVASSGSITTKTAVSRAINFQASLQTVKDLVIQNVPASVPAGQQFVVQVAALDNSGSQVVGADDVLSAQVFSATDNLSANLSTHLSPSNAAPTIPTSYLFVSGAANVPFTLTKKESLQFKVVGSSGMQSALASVSVLSSDGINYSITCRLVSNNNDCSGTSGSPYQIVASRANLFNLVVESVDIYGNKKAGSASLYLATVKVSAPAGNRAVIASTTSKSYTNVNTVDNFITFSAADENGITLDNLYYGAPNQTLSFDLPTRESGSSITKNAYISFLPHIDAVRSYDLTGFGSGQFAAGTTKAFKLSALDYGGNVITGIDAALNAQTYVWTGTGVSVGGWNNVLPTASLTFTSGASQNLSATFYAADNALLFSVKDNFTTAVSLKGEGVNKNRLSRSSNGDNNWSGTLNIDPKAPSVYTLSGISAIATAGTPFSLSISAKDIYGNAAQNWNDSLTFSYLSGASSSIATPADGTVRAATKAANVTNQSFPNGIYSVPGTPFTLYRSNLNVSGVEENTVLKIQGTNTATESGVALSTTFNIKTVPKPQVSYTKITNNAVYSSANDLSGINQSYSSDQIYNYFASLFDQYGNFLTVSGGVASTVQWSGTGAMSGKLFPTTGLTSALAPTARGTGVVTADCSAISGCISDSTGTISISTGPLSAFSIVDTQTSAPVNLGSEIPFTLCMKDAVGNTIDTSVYVNSVLITNPNATLNLEFRKANITDTPEMPGIEVSKASGGSFAANKLNVDLGLSSVTFVNGCTQLYAKIYSSASSFGEGLKLLNVRYDDANQPLRGTISSLGLDVPGVNATVLDHYVTTASNLGSGAVVQAYSDLGTTNVQGSAGGNRFSITVQARDVYGNALVRTNAVNLFAVKSDGTTSVGRSLVCSAPANDTSCINPTFSSSSSLTVNNLALDVAGSFYINAVDSNSKGIKAYYSTLVVFNASPKTVKQYTVIQPSLTNAGLSNFIQVRAEDNSGNPVSGADTALNAQTYTWFHSGDSSNMTTHIAPDGTNPILLSTLSFSAGVANAPSTFTKAETGLLLNIRDNASPQKTSSNVSTLDVLPGLQLYYDIICKKVSDASDCTGTSGSPATLIGSAASKFNLEFQALDQYKNPKLGEGATQIRIIRVSGAATGVGKLESPDPVNYAPGNSPEILINMSTTAMVPQSNMFYRGANQTNRIWLINTLADGFYRTPYITFTPTIDTVTNYGIQISGSGIAGVPQSVTVFARDSGGNAVSGIDAQLNSQSYTWSGLVTSPNGSTPTYPSSALTFANGTTSGLSATMVKSGGAALNLVDNYVPCGSCSSFGGGGPSKERTGGGGFSIYHAPANSYAITGGGASTNAGVPFDLTFTALDQFENPATSWTTDTLSFAWSGATSTVVNPKNPSTTFSPTLASNGLQTFTSGVYSTTSTPFNLYKAESPTLTVTGTVTAGTKNTAAITGTRVFSVLPNNTAGYVRLSQSPVSTNPTLSGSTLSLFTDLTMSLYAYLYDAYGNLKSDASGVSWTGSGALTGKLSPTTGAATIFAPTSVGSGTVTAACTGVSAGCVSDVTGTIDVQASSVSKLVFISPSPSNNFTQLTTACQELKIQTQDLVSNPANVNSLTTFTFASTGGNGNGDFFASSTECNTTAQGFKSTLNTASFHSSSTLGGSAGNRTLNMASGTNVLSVWYANRTSVASNAAVITVTASNRTATLNATILPDVAKRASFVTTTPTVNAVGSPSGTCLTLNYRFDDIWGNQQSLTSASTINLSVIGTDQAATIYSDSGCTASITSRSLSSGNQDTVYYKDTKANRSTFNILSTSTLNGSAIQAAVTLNIDVLPGTFTVTQTPTSGSNTKDTVTLLWGASAGAKNYKVFRATAPNCTTGATPINSTVVGTSVSFTTGQNGTYYICVVANSYTSGGTNLNATNYGSYYFTIDNTFSTGSITAPAATEIGPVTALMGAGSTTTFAGTAADTGGSGLLKVELEIKNTTSNTYWDGSTWTAGPGPVVLAVNTTSWSYVMNDSSFTDGASYSIRAQVTDNSLNVTTNAQTKTFTWDATAPTVSITAFGNLLSSYYYSNLSTLNTAITTASGAIKYKYYTVAGSSCSGGSYSSLANVGTNITASPGADGQYTLCVLGQDLSENVQATPTAFTWYKDTGLPTISGGVPNMGPVNAAFTPSLTAATDSGAPSGSAISYLWSVTGNAPTCATSFTPGSTTSTTQNPAITSTCGNTFGTSNLKLRVSDTAGNFTDYNPTFNWDQQSRTISAISSPTATNANLNAGNTVYIDVTFSSGANTNSANVFVAGGTPTLALNTTPAQSATYLSGSGTTILRFQYVVQATDNVAVLNVASTSALSLNGATIKDTYNNNVSLTTSTTLLTTKNIKIDTLAPTLALSGFPTGESNVTSTLSVAISATDTTSYTFDIVSGTSAACPGTQSGTTPQATPITRNIAGLADGNVTICARATDLAGNVQSGYTSQTWIKDTQAPATVTGVGPTVEVNTLTPTITWTAGAADVTNYKVIIYSNTGLTTSVYDSGWISSALTSQVVSPALPRDGKYFTCLFSRDLAGNQSTCSAVTFSVETDTLHTSWYESGVVKYGKKTNTSAWAAETAASGLSYQGRTSLAVDNSGNPIIGYSTINGSDSYFRYSRWNGSAWTAYLAHTSATYTAGGTLGELAVASSSPTFHLGFLGLESGIPSFGAEFLNITSTNVATGANQALADVGATSKDLSVFVDAASLRYVVATPQSSGSYRPQIVETSTLSPALLALPTNCTDMPYISGVSTATGNNFVLAGLCVMNPGGSCQVWSSSFTFNSGTGTFSAPSWTSRGTTTASSCTLAGLSLADRPTIMQDKQTDKTTIVFVDRTNNKIVRSTNESGGWANEDVVTGLTGTYGFPFLAIDQYSKSYVTYVDNGVLKMIHNNGREVGNFLGGWNTPTVISNTGGLSGFGGIGITGMKGRGNFTGGK
ncbi:MAG: hypothetical protein WCI18_11495 [Pseudomonadota bacterium]